MIVALAGGVGGAKLANGLTQILSPEELLIAVNTGDDFEHLGLHISPDLDSVMYRLAGLNDTERGWGLADESWNFMAALKRLGGEDWFNLGDQDLATHIERTRLLRDGKTLTEITSTLCARLWINHQVLPMSDDPVRTVVETADSDLPFQDYFVRLQCEPEVTGFRFDGADSASPLPDLVEALHSPALNAIIICPSNPYVSIAPILAMPAIRAAIDIRTAPCIAVSPIIGGKAVKGPAAKMMGELGVDSSSEAIASHYGPLIDTLVIDEADANQATRIEENGTRTLVTPTLMHNTEDETRLAHETLALVETLQRER